MQRQGSGGKDGKECKAMKRKGKEKNGTIRNEKKRKD